MKDIAILGTAYGYQIEQVEVFLRSCSQAMPDADVFLFIDVFDNGAIAKTKEYCPGSCLIKPRDHRLRTVIKKFPRG